MSSSAAASDELLEKLYKLHKDSGLGGEWKMVDAVFSFLRRKTPLLRSEEGAKRVRTFLDKHAEAARKSKSKKTKTTVAKPAAASSSTAGDDDVIEISTDKPGAAEQPSKTPKKQEKAAEEKAEVLPDADDKPVGPKPIGNGGKTDAYVWTQTLQEVTVHIPIPKVKSNQVSVEYDVQKLHVGLKGQKPIIDGELCKKILSDEVNWTLEEDKEGGGKMVTIYMPKMNQMEWWKNIVVGDPEIDTRAIEPENSKLEDLDGDTRQTVEKMMFDQRMKQMGKPTSDEQNKADALKKFMAAHPEMDFSNAKIS